MDPVVARLYPADVDRFGRLADLPPVVYVTPEGEAGKTLSESLMILGRFKEDRHIDPDLFDVFVGEKLYLRYAREFLPASQIDEERVAQLPGFGG